MAGPTRIRDRRVRVADNLSDDKTSPQIQLALPSSITQEDLQVFFLSRLREVIFGGDSSKHWYDEFAPLNILSLAALSNRKLGVPFIGSMNGENRLFTLPDFYLHTDKISLDVFHNGRRLTETQVQDPRTGDFICVESGGLGTGYDAIVLLTFAPNEDSVLVANYQVLT